MPIRISEKKLLLIFLLVGAGLYALYAVQLTASPVRISERGAILTAAAIGALFLGVKLSKSVVRTA